MPRAILKKVVNKYEIPLQKLLDHPAASKEPKYTLNKLLRRYYRTVLNYIYSLLNEIED